MTAPRRIVFRAAIASGIEPGQAGIMRAAAIEDRVSLGNVFANGAAPASYAVLDARINSPG
ncbi:hypothetical protein [Lysobacter sp. CA199]|uniref:hypothetical protein n=1 Tax=Lysobacter sp. CA199 TaxID=3455608 RepID=UPI003F8D1743